MQVESPDLLRNLAVVGHNDTGKTTLVSGLLHTAGAVNRHLRVEDGNTVTDFDQEEIDRGISIGLAPCFAPWKKHKINLIDCPGSGIFLAESRAGLRASDAALLSVNAVAGVQVTTEKVWAYAEEMDLPVMVALTKMDRENADFDSVISTLQGKLARSVVAIQVPIGSEHDFNGVVDLVTQKAYTFEKDGDGKAQATDIPDDLKDQIEIYRSTLVEAVAETDEELMESFFEAGDLTDDQLVEGLKKGIRSRDLFPVALTSGGHGIGNEALLDAVISLCPSPSDRGSFPATDIGGEEITVSTDSGESVSAIVFKTLSDPFTGKISLFRVVSGVLNSDTNYYNTRTESEERVGHLMTMQGRTGENVPKLVAGDIGGVAKLKATATGDTLCEKSKPIKLGWFPSVAAAISFAIEPKSKGDEEKVGEACTKLVEEDPTLEAGRDPQTGEFLLAGTGQLHVEIAVAKMKSRYKVEVILHQPKVPYRETIRKPAEGHGRHKKQSGGRGQFADCKIMMEPLNRGDKFEFADEIFGGSIPQNYRPAVEKGIIETSERGYLAGYPVVDFKVRLLDGQYHDVDSSEMAFKIAGSLAFKDAMERAAPTILEPVMQLEVHTSEEFMGDIMSDLSQRRGKPQGMEARDGDVQVVKATVPLAEMLNYETALRSMTQGRSSFTMEYSHYEEVPRNVQEKIIQESKREAEEAH